MDDQLKTLAEGGIFGVLDFLWETRYIPELNAKIAKDSERRADAFSDAPFEVFGESLRQMTPRDLVYLEGMDSPFVAGGPEATADDVVFFLWSLNAQNDSAAPIKTAFRRGRFIARVAERIAQFGHEFAVYEVFEYLDRIFIDLPTGDKDDKDKERKPPSVHCVAPLLVDVAGIMGPRDPINGKWLGDTAIPRLIQYRTAASEKAGGKQFTEMDSARVRCMDEANQIMREYRALATEG